MPQTIQKSPLLLLDKATVIGYLKSTGSRDPDVLHAQKRELLSAAKFPKFVGLYLMIMGGLLCLLIIGAFIGLPMIGIGWWMRRRGSANLEAVEAGFAEYAGAIRAA